MNQLPPARRSGAEVRGVTTTAEPISSPPPVMLPTPAGGQLRTELAPRCAGAPAPQDLAGSLSGEGRSRSAQSGAAGVHPAQFDTAGRIRDALLENAIFRLLPEGVLDRVAAASRLGHARKGKPIFGAGAPAEWVGVLADGRGRVTKPDGAIVAEVNRGDLLGVHAMRRPDRQATITAIRGTARFVEVPVEVMRATATRSECADFAAAIAVLLETRTKQIEATQR